MKLFDNFEAIKFGQEKLIFVTDNGYLHYIYNPSYLNTVVFVDCYS